MIVAVTGATGVVGRFVCDHFTARGHQVRGLRRPTSNLMGYRHPVEWQVGGMDSVQALTSLLNGADVVIHCAFSHQPGKYRGGEGADVKAFWRTNFDGTLSLLELADRLDVSRVVLLSSRAVFGQRRPGEDVFAPVADDHPLWPTSHYGALKAAEEALAGAFENVTVCALRATGVYGLGFPVATSKWFGLVQDVMAGKQVDQVRTSTEVHGVDVASAIECLLTASPEAVKGRGFNCSDITVTTRELVARIAERVGVQVELPEHGPPVVNPMSCAALRGLGWTPGGPALFNKTLDELVVQARGLNG
jgi:UDP-glucose 4-epimerase